MMSQLFYKDYRDIGSHEDFTKMASVFLASRVFRVTFVYKADEAILIEGEKTYDVEAGMVLGVHSILKTRQARVELRDQYQNIFRLESDSEFCFEQTIEGYSPVYYGTVMYMSNSNHQIFGGGKYRTSCWTTKNQSCLIERMNDMQDIYYSFDQPVEVYEYDEQGRRYSIVTIEPFCKCILSFDFRKSMRSRYTVVEMSKLKGHEIIKQANHYLLPVLWDEVYSDEEVFL